MKKFFMPPILAALRRNLELNDALEVRLVEVALGETPGTTEIHVFAGLPHGHASVSTLDRSDYSSHRVERHTLDDLLAGSRTPAFVKLDVEGSERDVLRGAEATLAAGCPPIWMIEVNYETSAAFGYRPPDLLEPFGAGHRVFRITDRGLEPEADPAPIDRSPLTAFALAVSVAGVLLLGLFPDPIINFLRASAAGLI